MKYSLFALAFLSVLQTEGQTRHSEAISVSTTESNSGIAIRRIPLTKAVTPVVKLENTVYGTASPVPFDTVEAEIKVFVGVDRKQPFAIIAVPTHRNKGQERLRTANLIVEEAANTLESGIPVPTLAKTTAGPSALATGNWHKIAVRDRGFYRIDYAFLSDKLKMTGQVPSSSIRLLGNGGTMLPEKNPTVLPDALSEVSLSMQDGGDGSFGPGDYFIFYAPGTMAWDADSSNQSFRHRKNLYEDRSYYFLSTNGTNGQRVATQGTPPTPSGAAISTYNAYAVQEEDKYNLGKFGKRWVGDEFVSGSKTYSFDLAGWQSPVRFRTVVAARNNGASENFSVSTNGQIIGNVAVGFNAGSDDQPCSTATIEATASVSGGNTPVSVTFFPSGSASRGYLDYIELAGRRSLALYGGQVSFRDWSSVAPGKITQFALQAANGSTQVWDVTNPAQPVRMNGSLNGSVYSFSQSTERLREFAAFDGSNLTTPDYVKAIPNQDLRGQGNQDYLIVTAQEFLSAANRLADWHRQKSNLRVLVATTEQVYNEFSSGGQDIGGIRDFTRYFYDRAGTDTSAMPKYLLLFGDASYDYKDRISGNTNYVPVFESFESDSPLLAYTADDYFGFLDANENAEGSGIYNVLDIGIGRLPAKSATEADQVVSKIMHYKSPATLGPWRLANTLVADNEDGAGEHLLNTEAMGSIIESRSSVFNDYKVYLDNTPIVSTPGGVRAPQANAQINNQIYKGTQFINYSGHGGTRELAHERILTADDYNRWQNFDKLPFMVTATCDFAQFDRPDFVSAGEQLILKPNGGTIAMLTTTQAVYASESRILNGDYLQSQFEYTAHGWRTFGEALRIGKNLAYVSKLQDFPSGPNWGFLLNFRKFSLLGDPALIPDFPARLDAVVTDSVVDMQTGVRTDTLSALGAYSLNGSVTSPSGTGVDASYNGRVYVTVYDKPRVITTPVRESPSRTRTYSVQNNIVFKGRASVTNGRFSIPFVVPKDLNYAFGTGFVQYYVEDGTTDAAGEDTALVVGGASKNPVSDGAAPVVRAFIGDSLFRDGGLTGSNTVLFAILEDETGINVSGNSVGHDLTAILDGNEREPYIINDYYESAPNTYKRGFLRFPVSGLANGMHTFTVKAWDVANNSGTGSVRFEVADGQVTRVQNLINYPNPFRTETHFRFEHNHPDESLTADMYIYTTSGALARRLKQDFTPTGSHSSEIVWDGTDENGALLPSGVYPYRLMITTAKGTEGFGYQKLVITR
jgi:hypothetical protein